MLPKIGFSFAAVMSFALVVFFQNFSALSSAQTGGFLSSLITTTHRYETGYFYGGWGAHLGHYLRSQSNGLWFVDDGGNNVNVNTGLTYYKFINGAWVKAGTNALPATVQQNMGSVISGNMIYTFGADFATSLIVECYYDISVATYHACNELPFATGPANYIGATIGKTGHMVVWWTAAGGTFSYIDNAGEGAPWNGPVTGTVAGYADFSYVFARLESDNKHIDFVGSAAHAPGGSYVGYDVLYASITLGNAITDWKLLQKDGLGFETWLDPMGGAHIFTQGETTPKYFYKPPGGVLTAEPDLPDAVVNKIGTVRIVETPTSANLVMAFSDGSVNYRSMNIADITGPIDWASLPLNNIPIPSGLGLITLYPESSMYQTNAPLNLDFGINGLAVQGSVYSVQAE